MTKTEYVNSFLQNFDPANALIYTGFDGVLGEHVRVPPLLPREDCLPLTTVIDALVKLTSKGTVVAVVSDRRAEYVRDGIITAQPELRRAIPFTVVGDTSGEVLRQGAPSIEPFEVSVELAELLNEEIASKRGENFRDLRFIARDGNLLVVSSGEFGSSMAFKQHINGLAERVIGALYDVTEAHAGVAKVQSFWHKGAAARRISRDNPSATSTIFVTHGGTGIGQTYEHIHQKRQGINSLFVLVKSKSTWDVHIEAMALLPSALVLPDVDAASRFFDGLGNIDKSLGSDVGARFLDSLSLEYAAPGDNPNYLPCADAHEL